MTHLKHFLHSTTAKSSSSTTLIIIIASAVVAYLAYTNGYLDNLNLPFSITGSKGAGDLVDVNKKLQFTWTGQFSGAVANAKTFYIYDETKAIKETLTTAATGIVASSQNYPSGTKLFIKYVDTNNKVWYEITVPQMNPHDADSSTYNDISLKYTAIGTYTADSLMMLGLTVGDGEQINATGNATTSPTFVYTLTNTGADNTGLQDSYDYVYDSEMQVWVTGVISGDNASLVIVNGATYTFTVGSNTYFAMQLDANSLSKWKVGSTYVPGFTGTDGISFSMDLTGFTATSAATMQITVYAYADPAYAMSHAGNFGPDKVQIAEQTVTLVDI